ncbi:hypothetical protein SAMN00120144_3985 [Hymenobacter roseosalivarius DSM 11622]|uniref:Right handed beta helix domain-containing protein n=1 Tax=Hymenobacter roseosalivarius DSM 11622 TaxID=645990 RepID=A0A1W1UF95_9BACT|nr:hypothetical protein [Hymenobacter roseosalivarius]SMB79719.1 hypothetical protein SAMN00120144_3985 [Hymenobacter roseosalivarius DSM 11622]
MRSLFPLLFICSALLCGLPGCESKEELLTTDSTAQLAFSADTVLFDTVFAQVGTVSKRLWVYNRQARAVQVSHIRLANASPGTYSLLINGAPTPTAHDLKIRGRDSLLILIKAVLGPGASGNQPFLVADHVLFSTNGNEQQVALIAYGQNAYFHGPEEHITRTTTWPKNRPHVLYGVVVVDAGVTLRLQPGTRVYAHAGAALLVRGTLRINEDIRPPGELSPSDTTTVVRFAGDRLESRYHELPGQWRGIQFDASSSRDNLVRFAEIKNASFGLLVYNPLNGPHPKVTVEQTVLRNMSGAALSFASGGEQFEGAGILSIAGDFDVQNCLFTNCGEYALRGIGGTYALNFCTIANYTPQFRRDHASLTFTNVPLAPTAARPYATKVTITNSIVWGSNENELLFENGSEYRSALQVENSILRTKTYAGKTDTGNQLGFDNNNNQVAVANPRFVSAPDQALGTRYDYRLDTLSPASDSRSVALPLAVPARDLLNKLRNRSTPDVGAYERTNP